MSGGYVYWEPEANEFTTDYLRRLLIERHAIRAALYNMGGSVILSGVAADVERAGSDYSGVIGNDFHLDLLEVEKVVSELTPEQRDELLRWADGLTAQQAAIFYNARPGALRMRRQRAIRSVARKMNSGGDRTQPGGTSGARGTGERATGGQREGTGPSTPGAGDHERVAAPRSRAPRDPDVGVSEPAR